LPGEPTVIPYVPLLFVPYMSIDFFFFLAAFLCRDERDLRVFARRVVFAILVAAAFFLLMPLISAWPERPQVGGWFGDLIEASCTVPFLMEYPHNLFPSLHVALCTLLADLYARQTRGIVRVLSHIWFSLIGISTILTWQHHFVDLAGGVLLAAFAFYLFRRSNPRLPVVANFRIGCYYAAGAAAVLVLGGTVWPWGAFLLWPATALGIVAAAYFGLGPGIFRKTDGLLPLSTRLVLAPVLLGQYFSLVYYRRQCRAWDEVAPGLLIGRRLTQTEAASAARQGVTAVLDLTAEFSEVTPFRATTYLNLPMLDLTSPTQDQLHRAIRFIAEESAKGAVYLHCKIGYSRSAAVAAAYLLASHQAATVEQAVARLRKVRPSIIIRSEAMQALRDFARAEKRNSNRVTGRATRIRPLHHQPS
jgi:protein-tyrosine phosphatase/membrane-associated phospholipid phosphatase